MEQNISEPGGPKKLSGKGWAMGLQGEVRGALPVLTIWLDAVYSLASFR